MIHHVYANRSNIGDWLSARGIQSLLRPLPIREHFCDEPFVQGTLRRLTELRPNDVLVVGGGGLFMDYFEPFWRGILDLESRVPLVVWGVGVCDLKAGSALPDPVLLDAVVRRSALCIVRDELSGRIAKAPDVPVACPSLCVLGPLPLEGGILHVDNYSTAGAGVPERIEAQAQAFGDRTGRMYRRTSNRTEAKTVAALEALLQYYARSDLIVSTALHGCIIGLALGRKVLAVSGDWKIEAFMSAAGLADWVLDVEDVDQVQDRLASLETQESVAPFLQREAARNAEIAERVRRLVGDPPSCEQ